MYPSLTLKGCHLFAIIITLPAVQQHTSPSSPLLVSLNKNQTMHLLSGNAFADRRVPLAHLKPKDLLCRNGIKLKASKKIIECNKNGTS
jgi:hypothetical protein